MTLVYFQRPLIDTQRIFIGINYSDKVYRIGFKTVCNNNKLVMVRHFYEVSDKENIIFINNPDRNFIDKRDLDYIKIFNKIN